MIDAPTTEALTTEERAELEQLEAVIEQGFVQMGDTLLKIKDRGLYREYGTWMDYCRERWSKSARRIDQLISASRIAAAINKNKSSQEIPSPTNESQVRHLNGLTPEQAAATWETAVEVYETDSPTTEQVKNTRERLETEVSDGTPQQPTETEADKTKRLVYAAGYSLVTQRMNEGWLSPKKALAICDALESVMPRVRGDLLKLEVFDDVMIRELNRLFKKKSESYDEIIASGHLQFENSAIPIQKAKAADLRNWLDWKQEEHRRNAFADKLVRDRYEAKIIDVDDNCIEFRIPGIQHDLKEGDRVLVTIVRV